MDLWRRLDLTARLMIGLGIGLASVGCALLYAIVAVEVQRERAQLERHLNAEADLIVPAVAEQAVIGDYALIEQMLRSRVEKSYIRRAAWFDSEGRRIEAQHADVPLVFPPWFARWAGLPEQSIWRSIEIGGERYGSVLLVADTREALNHVWDDATMLMAYLLAGIALVFCITFAIVRNALRPLRLLAETAMRFGKGDYSTRIAAQGTPEVSSTVVAFNGMAADIQRLVSTLDASRERAQVTLASIADAVVTSDVDGNVEYLNPVAQRLTGWTLEQAVGRPLAEVIRIEADQGQALLLDAAGQRHAIEHAAAPIRCRDGKTMGAVLVFRDVSESRKMARQLSWQATHDALTGLVNRAEFERRLDRLAKQAKAQGAQHALLYLDLDQFKVVNDTCGHVAGDELLRQVTALLASRVRETDTLARLGGDEFGVVLVGCSPDNARAVAEGMRQAIAQFRFAWQDKTFVIGISIGLVAMGGGESAERALAAADAACYSAKDKGRNRVQAYLPGDRELAERQGEMQWVSRITRALEEDRLILYCQRIRPAQTGRRIEPHYEILVRMIDETGNITPPMSFLPAAERYNLMPAIDRRVVARTFELAARLASQEAQAVPTFSINLSGASLNEDAFLPFLQQQFAQHGVSPGRMCFEITETVAIANLTRARRLMSELRSLGCRFSLDDFGSGLSSFGYLKTLPIDYLKIDGAFVKDMAADPISRALVKAIHDVGHVMGIETIAEWVDNDETVGMLRQMGVDYVQGYGVEKPMPVDHLFAPASRPMGRPHLAAV